MEVALFGVKPKIGGEGQTLFCNTFCFVPRPCYWSSTCAKFFSQKTDSTKAPSPPPLLAGRRSKPQNYSGCRSESTQMGAACGGFTGAGNSGLLGTAQGFGRERVLPPHGRKNSNGAVQVRVRVLSPLLRFQGGSTSGTYERFLEEAT